MKRYHFVLENIRKETMSGDAHTLAGVKRIFKRMNAEHCVVYKRHLNGNCPNKPIMTLHQ